MTVETEVMWQCPICGSQHYRGEMSRKRRTYDNKLLLIGAALGFAFAMVIL